MIAILRALDEWFLTFLTLPPFNIVPGTPHVGTATGGLTHLETEKWYLSYGLNRWKKCVFG